MLKGEIVRSRLSRDPLNGGSHGASKGMRMEGGSLGERPATAGGKEGNEYKLGVDRQMTEEDIEYGVSLRRS